MEKQTVIQGKAQAGAAKPKGAVSSVFDAGRQAKPSRTYSRVDPAALKIEQNVPIPEARRVVTTSAWPAVYARMKKGDMVRLPPRQALSFMAWGKKNKASLARRSLSPEASGVWRTA